MQWCKCRGYTIFLDTLVPKITGSTTISEDVVVPSGWSATDAEKFKVNQGLVSDVVVTANNINIKVSDVSALEEWTSSAAGQGTHDWIAVDINTGVKDIKKLTYNGEALTQADVDEAAAWGLGAGHIILWLKGEEVTQLNPKEITLAGDNVKPITFTVTVEDLA